MPISTRRTQMGACAECGGYRESGHLSTCNADRTCWLRPDIEFSRQARPDPRRVLIRVEYLRIRLAWIDEDGDDDL
jgi:hypothetical protein